MKKAVYYTRSFGFQWLKHAKTQLDSYVGKPISRNRLFSVTGWSQRMEGQRILEAGLQNVEVRYGPNGIVGKGRRINDYANSSK